MDWANERYVRLYTRDTTTWRLLSWQAQALFPALMRIVDRAGVFDLGGVTPAEAVAAALPKWPREVIAEGLVSLAGGRDPVIEMAEDCIVVPNFLEAQEAAASQAQRQRDSREKRRALSRGHKKKQAVTERDQSVTPSHTASPQPSQPSVPPSPPSGRARRDDETLARAEGLRTHESEARRAQGLVERIEQVRGEVSRDLQADIPSPTHGGGRAIVGIQAALRECNGDETELLAVVRDAAERLAAGRIERDWFRKMFTGGLFGRRRDDWLKARGPADSRAAKSAETLDRIKRQLAGEL